MAAGLLLVLVVLLAFASCWNSAAGEPPSLSAVGEFSSASVGGESSSASAAGEPPSPSAVGEHSSASAGGEFSNPSTVSELSIPSAAGLEYPPYAGEPSVNVNGNMPYFTKDDLAREPFMQFSALDSLGRCGVAYALLSRDTMPEGRRGGIGMVKPSGWQVSKYDWIDGKYLYNRCHLIAHALSGQNDNELNLITGTRTMNALGMLPYEEQTASYIRSTGNHVLYRVTPVFEGDNLVASGVLMEAESVEDGGEGIRFCVWCYNVEPGVVIDYATGDNCAEDPREEAHPSGVENDQEPVVLPNKARASGGDGAPGGGGDEPVEGDAEIRAYVLNTNTKRFHLPDCPSVQDMKEKNKREFEGTREEAIELGYKPCGACNP